MPIDIEKFFKESDSIEEDNALKQELALRFNAKKQAVTVERDNLYKKLEWHEKNNEFSSPVRQRREIELRRLNNCPSYTYSIERRVEDALRYGYKSRSSS